MCATPRAPTLTPSKPRIVSRADDAGSAASANLAIRRCLHAQAVTAVGFMVPAPAFQHAVDLLSPSTDTFDVGLHATINAEWDDVRWGPVLPAAKVPSLVDEDGNFLRRPEQLKGRLEVAEMLAEITAQLERLQRSGLRVHYLDTHMCFEWLPGVSAALHEFCRRAGLHFVSCDPPWLPRAEQRAASATRRLPEAWLDDIAAVPRGTYQLVTHPGMDAEDMRIFVHRGLERGQIARERAAETEALCDPRFASGLRKLGVELVRYSSRHVLAETP